MPDIVRGVYGKCKLDTLVCGHGLSVDRKIRVAPVRGNEYELAVAMWKARGWLCSNGCRNKKSTRK